ncbi:hypothetical protein [Endothiovibrio diazotrophicus]
MNQPLFADTIEIVEVGRGLVRFNLKSLSAGARDERGRLALEVRQHVVMPLDGFVHTVAAMEQVVQRLVESGAVTVAPKTEEEAEPVSSPNFG